MPKVGRTLEIRQLEHEVDPANRFVDPAVRLRVLREDGSRGDPLSVDMARTVRDHWHRTGKPYKGHVIPGQPIIFGGRWDRWLLRWVRPQPADLKIWDLDVQEQQLPLLFLPSDCKAVALFSGRQAGKTHGSVLDILLDWIRSPGRSFGIVSLNFQSSRDPEKAWRKLLAPWWDVHHNKSDRIYTSPHGAQVVFRSEEAIESLRGPSLKGLLLDEYAYMQHMAFVTAIGCGAAASDFRIRLATTPKRENQHIREIDAEWESRPAHAIVRLRTDDNPKRDLKAIAFIRSTLSSDLVSQELDGKILPPQDQVYCVFKRSANLAPLPDLKDYTRAYTAREFLQCDPKDGADYLAGWDFGIEAMVMAKVFRTTRRFLNEDGRLVSEPLDYLYIVGEEVADGRTTTDHHARLVVERWKTKNICIFTDAMGEHDGSIAGVDTSAIKLLQAEGFRMVRRHGAKNPLVTKRVRTVNRLIDHPDLGARLFIVPGKAPKLVNVLENQRMVNGKPDKDGTEHVVDALGYLCLATFPIADMDVDGYERPFAGKEQSP